MEIKNLSNTPLPILIDCLLESFADYFVQMPDDLNYWKNRFRGARVRLDLSFGMFDQNNLVGYIINGIDEQNGQLTAFNTGTGVIPNYRGRAVVDQLYKHAIPILKANGVEKCALEVIQQNHKAIRVYERIGFSITRKLMCFKGSLDLSEKEITLQKTSIAVLADRNNTNHKFYSWDNLNEAIKISGNIYKCYFVVNKSHQEIGYFIINKKNGYVAQTELSTQIENHNWEKLFFGIQQKNRKIRINNVDDRRVNLIQGLFHVGLDNHIDQFEMEMNI